MTDLSNYRKAYNAAIALLARREHSSYELMNKLKKYDVDIVRRAISECQSLDLQSDLRFAEMLCRTRINQGSGPRRIENDLQFARVDKYIIQQVLAEEQENWVKYAIQVWQKKYQHADEDTLFNIEKQKRFLFSRGFDANTISQVIKSTHS